MKFYIFRTVPLSIIRSFSLYTQQWYMSNSFADSLRAGSGWNCKFRPEPTLKLLTNLYVWWCVQWKTPDDGQRNCPKHVEFYSKNKFEKLVHLVGFIIRNTRFVQKVSGLTTVHEVDKTYGVLTLIIFNIVPFRSYTFRPTLLPLLETFCELLFRDV